MSTEIIRDVDGIAHVRATDLRGAFFGQGYAAAQDRLWQMEFDRRKALGRVAEILGPSGLNADRYHLRLGIALAAQRDVESFDDQTTTMFAAYADGVNAFLDTDPDLPEEFEVTGAPRPARWEPWHSVAVYKMRHFWMGTSDQKLWRAGLVAAVGAETAAALWPSIPEVTIDPDLPAITAAETLGPTVERFADQLATIFDLSDDGGSNNLVISGTRTVSGAPIVAGDPHRGIDLPNCYWQNHLTWNDGDHDVIGLSFAGVPGWPHFGHNDQLAWCITHGMADDQDNYVEQLRPAGDGWEYRSGDDWLACEVRTEIVPVAGADDETVTCITTGNGAVVADGAADGSAISVQWTGTADVDTTYNCLLPQAMATTVDELDEAFHAWVLPCNNVLSADRNGDIDYRFRGRLAIRPETNGWTVTDGTDPANRWSGFVADDALPRHRNPGRGYLVTANSRVGGPDLPHISNDFSHPARAARLTHLLGERDDWTPDSVGATLGDTHSAVAASFAARLTSFTANMANEKTAQRLLTEWDHHMDKDSAPALIFAQSRAELLRLFMARHGFADGKTIAGVGYTMANVMRAASVRLAFAIDDHTMVPTTDVRAALRMAVQTLSQRFGADPTVWRWGATHTAGFYHPMAAYRPDLAAHLTKPAPVELGGDTECLWASGWAAPSLAAVTSPVARYVFDVADWDNSRWVAPHGVSGNAATAHYDDQLEAWSTVQYRPMRYSAAAVDAAAETRTVFRP